MVKFWISFGKAQTFFQLFCAGIAKTLTKKRNFDQRKLRYIILKPFINGHLQEIQSKVN